MNGENNAVIVLDLGFGDAGKGSITDYLARTRPVHTVVRYNGGAQAAHNVITPDGRHHVFAQFGSASFLPGVSTHLSRFTVIHPLAMMQEARDLAGLGLGNVFKRTTIEEEAPVITPFQQAVNRLREISRGKGRHGSCGLGVGETVWDSIRYPGISLKVSDIKNPRLLLDKLTALQEKKLAEARTLPDIESAGIEEFKLLSDPEAPAISAEIYGDFIRLANVVNREYLGKVLEKPGTTVFEGAQGVLLDEWYGFHPYTTWSTITFQNALTILSENSFTGRIEKLGLLRAYATRHGAGPFVTEDGNLTRELPEAHNGNNDWQREFRVGYFDLVAARYALEVTGGADGLVISALDRLEKIPDWKIAGSYRYQGSLPQTEKFFRTKGREVDNIIVNRSHDLEYQEGITERLSEMAPNYRSFTNPTIASGKPTRSDLLSYQLTISKSLGLPVLISSYGPTARDKKEEKCLQ